MHTLDRSFSLGHLTKVGRLFSLITFVVSLAAETEWESEYFPSQRLAIPELEAILEDAIKNAPALIEQDFFREEAAERLSQAKADYYPRVDLRANLGLEQEYRDEGAEDRSDFGFTYSARLTRPLYHWGAIEARIQQARLDNETASLNYQLNTMSIARSIRAQYLQLLVNQAELSAELVHREILEDELERVQGDFQTGKISERTFRSKELDLQDSLLAIRRIERDQNRIAEQFQTTAGWKEPLSLSTDVPKANLVELIAWVKGCTRSKSDYWTTHYPSLKLNQKRIDRQVQELKIITAKKRPLLNFSASASQDQSNTSTRNNVDTLALFAGVSVHWNIFDGFQTKHELIEARLKRNRLKARQDRISENLFYDREVMLDRILHQAENNLVLEKRLEIERNNFSDRRSDAEAGQLSDAQLKKTELDLMRLTAKVMVARADMLMQLSDYIDLVEPVEI